MVILWMAMPGNEVANTFSKTFAEAAGVEGRQKWGLVLSSSARVTQMTYQTVIGVRYPELVTTNPTGCTFGRFVPPDEDLQGSFLPVFWDVPRANLHAVVDIGAVVDWLRFQFTYFRDAKSSLAVLHNQTDMVTHFKASSWVSEAQGAVVSRGVTTCAGMTAHTVIVAQTKILPYWRPTSELSCFASGRARYSAGRSLWTCHGCSHSSPVTMRHSKATWYERIPWSCYCHWLAYVWGWPCIQRSSQLLFAREFLSGFSIWCSIWWVAGKEQQSHVTRSSTACYCGGPARQCLALV